MPYNSLVKRLTAISTAIGTAMLSALLSAHPGHGEKAMLAGKIVAMEPTRVQLEIFDRASFSTRRVWVVVDEHTGVRAGKARLTLKDLHAGLEVECASDTDEGPDGASFLRAVTFRLKSAK
jgi:hypothetical protein